LWGFRYGQLLISREEFDEAIRNARLAQTDPERPKGWVEGIQGKPLNQLIEGQARVRLFLAGANDDPEDIEKTLRRAIDGHGSESGLRNSYQYWLLIPALLILAEALRVFAKWKEARETVADAKELADVLDLKTYQLELANENATYAEARGDRLGARRQL